MTTNCSPNKRFRPATLPTTTEGASSRYLKIYRTLCPTFQSEVNKLANQADAKITALRIRAPKFYEEALPTLINQAASHLLACEVKTPQGANKFHQTHRTFLLILDGLRTCQPEEALNFQTEKDRLHQRDEFVRKQLQLRQQLNILDSTEISCDDLGSDNKDYEELMKSLDETKKEFFKISLLIVKTDAGSIEEAITFKLKIPARSILERLTPVQRDQLEGYITDFLKEKDDRKGITINQTVIEDILLKLNIGPSEFTKDEWRDVSKEALDACKRYFRDKANLIREQQFDELLKNPYLRPKEGLILESPEDLPQELLDELDQNGKRAKKKIEEIEEDFVRAVRSEEEVQADDLGDCDDDDDEIAGVNAEVAAIVSKSAPEIFARVKEEPRDDYVYDGSSDEEIIINIPTNDNAHNGSREGLINEQAIESEPSTSNPFRRSPPTELNYEEASKNIDKFLDSDSNEDDEESAHSQESECVPLGLITPKDKIELINIDSDDE